MAFILAVFWQKCNDTPVSNDFQRRLKGIRIKTMKLITLRKYAIFLGLSLILISQATLAQASEITGTVTNGQETAGATASGFTMENALRQSSTESAVQFDWTLGAKIALLSVVALQIITLIALSIFRKKKNTLIEAHHHSSL